MRINLLSYFEETVKKNGDKIAVRDGERKMGFRKLKELSQCFAAAILKTVKQEEIVPVAVYLPKCMESIAADIGILYSGNMYMNLDIKMPEKRIENVLSCIKPAAIITNGAYAKRIQMFGIPVIVTEEIKITNSSFVCKKPEHMIDTDPMCIINTSGSTGTPKGVVLNHRSFIDFTEWALEEFTFEEGEIIGSLSPIVFDIYSFELCLMMAKGCALVVIPDTYAVFPAKLMSLLNEEKVTFIFWVPTIMVHIANMNLLEKIPPQYLKMIWFAGEVFPTKQFNIWRKSLPETKFVNLYGPIEITLDCTYYVAERELKDEEPIPIGYPCKNTDVFLLKDDNTLAADGEEGELCVRGTSLAGGYYNNWEKTRKVFTQNPLNNSYPELIYRTGDLAYKNQYGEFIFKGRQDTLIKHSGYRIELGEIEHVAINTLKCVENCCVLYNKEKKQIIMIYEHPGKIEESLLRKRFSEVIPTYMIPAVFIQMPEMPRNTNGKIDRLKLRNMYDGT